MGELVLLTVVKRDFDRLHKRALKGDQTAVNEMDAMFSAYQAVLCFLCDVEIQSPPPGVIMLPEHGKALLLIAAPLCSDCRDLPFGTKYHRAIKVLRQMFRHKVPPGKQIHYDFAQPHRHQNRR